MIKQWYRANNFTEPDIKPVSEKFSERCRFNTPLNIIWKFSVTLYHTCIINEGMGQLPTTATLKFVSLLSQTIPIFSISLPSVYDDLNLTVP